MEAPSAAQHAWTQILGHVQGSVSDQTYRTWFAPLTARSYHSSELTVDAPNPFFVDWLEEHHRSLIEEAATEAIGEEISVRLSVSESYSDAAVTTDPAKSSTMIPQTSSIPKKVDRMRLDPVTTSLNSRFTFDNFVVGKSNEFCFAACEGVAKNPGNLYNPLFIYGGVGLGKTHIMQAIGFEVMGQRERSAIRYVSSEKFMNEMIQSIKQGTTFEFKNTYRSADLLLIDDIQFLAGKEGTQEEFFHTFNTLYDAHKQIVITSDRPPRELQEIENRLVSRFSWGLVTDISPPDFETRVAILRRKAEQEGLELPDDVVLLIAERVQDNVRELEGSLIRLSAYLSLTKQTIDVKLAEQFLKDMFRTQTPKKIDPVDVIRVTSRRFDVSVDAIKGRRRTQQVALARQVAMYLLKQLTGASLVEIGKRFGRDHTTVLYACDRVESLRKKDPELDQAVEELLAALRNGGYPD